MKRWCIMGVPLNNDDPFVCVTDFWDGPQLYRSKKQADKMAKTLNKRFPENLYTVRKVQL